MDLKNNNTKTQSSERRNILPYDISGRVNKNSRLQNKNTMNSQPPVSTTGIQVSNEIGWRGQDSTPNSFSYFGKNTTNMSVCILGDWFTSLISGRQSDEMTSLWN